MRTSLNRSQRRAKKIKAAVKGKRIGTRKAIRKPRFVDGHEAVRLTTHDDWVAARLLIWIRAGGSCECGCGRSLEKYGMEAHHWKGRTRGNRCDCVFHLQALTPECHREAEKHRKGSWFRSVKDEK